MGGNESFFSHNITGEGMGGRRNEPKGDQNFSIGVESYVPIITYKGFFTQSQVLLSSIVAVGNV